MGVVTQMLAWTNAVMNAVFGICFAPIAALPGWLSITAISAVLGVLLLVIFKYTSNQTAIGRIRDDIKANLLAVKLFKDSIAVTFRSQVRVFAGSLKLLLHAIIPMLVMMVPVCLILAQMGLWYQARPLQADDEPVLVKVKLNDRLEALPPVTLEDGAVAQVTVGPVRVFSKKEVYWKVKPLESGTGTLVFRVDDRQYEKRIAVGEGFLRVSAKRPGLNFADVLLYPLEKPFEPESPVQAISIEYPDRPSKISGTDWWILYFFIASMAFAFLFKPLLKVRI